MRGYIHAKWQKGNEDTSDSYFGFQNWVANRYGVSKTLGWADVITLYSSSEDHAFDITVDLWKEYKNQMTVGLES